MLRWAQTSSSDRTGAPRGQISSVEGSTALTLTPHTAGSFCLPETDNRIIRIAADSLQAWLDDAPMRNVTPHR